MVGPSHVDPAPGARALRTRRSAGRSLALAAGLVLALALPAGAITVQGLPVLGVSGAEPSPAPTADAAPVATPAPSVAPVATPSAAATLEPTAAPGPTVPPTPLPAYRLEGYRWPLARGRLTTNFGPTDGATWVVGGRRFHDGIDLASFCGDTIRAAHDGTVLVASRRFDAYLGWDGSLDAYEALISRKGAWRSLPITVVIDDGNGYRSIYAHLGRVSVRRGDRVRAGDPIGTEGRTGHATGCHLHYGLFSPLEPMRFALRGDLVRKWSLPAREIARIDPREVLPPLPATIRLGWGVTPLAPEVGAARRAEILRERFGAE